MTNVPGVCLFLTFADCVPIVLCDPRQRAIGLAHAGWRGTLAGVGAVLTRAMIARFGCRPADLRAAIAPSIGPCCYEVGVDVGQPFAARWASATIPGRSPDGRATCRVDLWEANRQQLLEAGVGAENVQCARVCTSCNTDRFFSHRAQHGKAGRFAALVMMR
jgi:YfiH family protein